MAIVDLDEWAESRFSALCAEAGVTRNKSSQDRTGWDYLVEFPARPLPYVPADLQPLGPAARVQVKSKRMGPPSARLKLSNALNFAKSPEACFVVLFLQDAVDARVRIYARHAWEPFITAVLKRGRQAEIQPQAALHRQTYTVRFTEADDHSHDLLEWMAQEVASVGSLYAAKKAALVQTVGIEGGGIHGTLSFEAIDWDQLVDHQLGLSDHYPVARVTIQQRRFGVDTEVIALKPDHASVKPHPRVCKVRVRGADRSEVWFNGEVFAPGFPGIPAEHFRYRVKADILDLIIAPADPGARRAKVSSSAEDQLSLEGMAKRLALLQMTTIGPLDVQMRIDGKIMTDACCKIDAGDSFDWVDNAALAVELLRAVAAEDLPLGLSVSMRDMGAAWPALVEFNGLVAGGDLTIRTQFDRPVAEVEGAKILLTWGFVEVGAWAYLAIVSRPIVSCRASGTDLEIICGEPELEEGLVRPLSDADRLTDLVKAYDRAVKLASEDAIEFFGGDYRQMRTAMPG